MLAGPVIEILPPLALPQDSFCRGDQSSLFHSALDNVHRGSESSGGAHGTCLASPPSTSMIKPWWCIKPRIRWSITWNEWMRMWSEWIRIWRVENVGGTTALKSQDQLKWLLPDGNTGGLVVSKVLSLNLNFSFLNWISLLLISSSYPIVLTRLGGPRSRPYTSKKISRV